MIEKLAKENTVWSLIHNLNSKKGITEIIINDHDKIFIERAGELIQLSEKVSSKDLLSFCQDVARINKKQFNRENPILDGSLFDGSRINIISPDFTGSSPAITIRKFLKNITDFDEHPKIFGMNEKWIKLLKSMVDSKMNIIVAGGTGCGKTTFLNLLLTEVFNDQRIITIEDTRELNFDHPNLVSLERLSSTASDIKMLTMRDLVKNTLRMRPDRIIIGEVRGEEALELLEAMNTGHEGSMCTVHASSSQEALIRLENLSLMSGVDIPARAIRQQICSAVDFVIHLQRTKSGKRVIGSIIELNAMEGEVILTSEITQLDDETPIFTGIVPSCMDKLAEHGLPINFFA